MPARATGPWGVNVSNRCLSVPRQAELTEELIQLHSQYGKLLLLSQNPSKVTKISPVVPPLSKQHLQIIAKLEHEIDHLRRHLGSSFGFLYHSIQSKRVDTFFHRFDLNRTDDDERLPWYPSTMKNDCRYSESVAENVREYYLLKTASELLDCSSPSPRFPLPEDGIDAISAIYSLMGVKPLPKSRTSNCNIPTEIEGSIFPIVQGVDGRKFKFGAHAILESLAISREMGLLLFAGHGDVRQQELFNVGIYGDAIRIWRDVFQLPYLRFEATDGFKSLGHQEIVAPPQEFVAALDLALWPPYFPPIESISGSFELQWSDIHPGWRFLKVLSILKDRKEWTPSARIDPNSDQWLQATQKEWCDLLGWPTPENLSHEWVLWLKSCHANRSTDKVWFNDDGARVAGALNLLHLKEKSPAITALGYPESTGSKVNWFEAVLMYDQYGDLHVWGDQARQDSLEKSGYPLPVAFGLLQGIEIFAEKLPASKRGFPRDVLSLTQRTGEKLLKCVGTYGQRHYQLKIEFGGSLPD